MKSSLPCVLLCVFLSACAASTAEPASTDILNSTPTPTALPTPLPTAIYLLNGQEEFELPEDNESIKAALGKMQELQRELIEAEIIESNSTIISIWTNPAITQAYGFVEVTSENSEYDKGTWIGYPRSEDGKWTFYEPPEAAASLGLNVPMKRIEAYDKDHKTVSSFIYFADESGYHLGAEWRIEGKYPENSTPWAIEGTKKAMKLVMEENDININPYIPEKIYPEPRHDGIVIVQKGRLVDYYTRDSQYGDLIVGRFVSPIRENEKTDNGDFERTIGFKDEDGNMQAIGWMNDTHNRYTLIRDESLSVEEFFDLMVEDKFIVSIENWLYLKPNRNYSNFEDVTAFPVVDTSRVNGFNGNYSVDMFRRLIEGDDSAFLWFSQDEIRLELARHISNQDGVGLLEKMDDLVKENNLFPIPISRLLTLD